VLPKYKTAIFVHGCFWHHHEGCRLATVPQTHREYWEAKFLANVERDRRKVEALRAAGWNVEIIWQCEIERDIQSVVRSLLQHLGVCRQDELSVP
jgi:DNA mismatch endonuclease (patch repair protein)